MPSADLFAQKIEAAGGTIVMPSTELPGVGSLVTFKDPSGNVFSIPEPVAANGAIPQPA